MGKELSGKDIVLLIIAFVGLVFFTFKAIQPNRDAKTDLSQLLFEKAGVVSKKKGKLRRKSDEEYVWEYINVGSPVYWNDSLFSDPGSSGEIYLEKSRIYVTLSEKTELFLEEKRDVVDIEIRSGQIKTLLGKGKSLGIKRKGKKKVVLKSSDDQDQTSLLIGNQKGTTAIALLSGKAKLSAGEESIELSQKNKIQLSESSEKIEVLKIPFQNLKPNYGEVFWRKENEALNIPLSWEGAEGVKKVVISEDFEFKKIVFLQETEKNSLILNQIKLNKLYYWRIEGKESNSEVNEFSVYLNSTPKILGIENLQVFKVKKEKLESDFIIGLQFDDESLLNEFQFQLAADKEFKESKRETFFKTTSYHLKLNNIGRYFIRVRSKRPGDILSPWSDVIEFEIKLKKQLRAPVIKSSYFKIFVNGLVEMLFPSAKANDLVNKELKWGEVEGSRGYKIILASDPEFKNVILEKLLEETLLAYEFENEGTYYWKVAAIDEDGEMGLWSGIQKFIVEFPKKKVQVEKVADIKKEEIKKKEIPLSSFVDKPNRYKIGWGLTNFSVSQESSNETSDILTTEASATSVVSFSLDSLFQLKNKYKVNFAAGLDYSSLGFSGDSGQEVSGNRLFIYAGGEKKIDFLFPFFLQLGVLKSPRFLISHKDGNTSELVTEEQFYLYQRLTSHWLWFPMSWQFNFSGMTSQLISPVFAELTLTLESEFRRAYKTSWIFINLKYGVQKRPLSVKDSTGNEVSSSEIKNNLLALRLGLERSF